MKALEKRIGRALLIRFYPKTLRKKSKAAKEKRAKNQLDLGVSERELTTVKPSYWLTGKKMEYLMCSKWLGEL
ncbi:hypothetical protein CUMW_216520 [Citrus unshiu]|uniref:Uncharacterized protein n=1 Tax=Citrus unshiu TaxID=55188 RepID=A0A2H5QCB4_CITUN|nr:hypothetical protein CUMW_216520 [Citrus unshiu]